MKTNLKAARALICPPMSRALPLLSSALSAWLFASNQVLADVNVLLTGELSSAIRENIYAELAIDDADETLSETQLRYLFERGYESIAVAVKPFGYFQPTITGHFQYEDNAPKVEYVIQLGPVTKIRSSHLSIEAPDVQVPEAIDRSLPTELSPGQELDQTAYERYKETLFQSAVALGYLDAHYTEQQIEVDLDENLADIRLTLSLGQRYQVGSITFDDGGAYSEAFLNRFMVVNPGDPLVLSDLVRQEQWFYQSSYFRNATVTQLDSEGQSVPLSFTLEPSAKKLTGFGVGYGTDTGPRAKVIYERRRLNDSGDLVRLSAKASDIIARFQLDYVKAGHFPPTDQLVYQFKFGQDEYANRHSRYWQFGGYGVQQFGEWRRIRKLTFNYERDDELGVDAIDGRKYLAPSVEWVFRQIDTDSFLTPNEGVSLRLRLSGVVTVNSHHNNFAQMYGSAKWLHTFESGHRFITRAEVGGTWPGDNARIPFSQRYYAGGEQSIRGFGYQQIPLKSDREGNPLSVGAPFLTTASAEWQIPLSPKLHWALFTDAGRAYRTHRDPWAVAIGTGLRYATPVGPIRFDVGQPITPNGFNVRIHLNFGPEL